MNELDKLEAYLKEKGIRYNRIDKNDRFGGFGYGSQHQICVFDESGEMLWDAICHGGSYGYEKGLLEIMGSIVDEKKVGSSRRLADC